MVARHPGPRLQDFLSLRRLTNDLLQRELRDEPRQGSILLIRNGLLLPPDCPALERDDHSFGLAVSLKQASTQQPLSGEVLLECASAELPFQDEVFNAVIMYLCIADGGEDELDEACRVLVPGGELLLLGLNRTSWRGMKAGRNSQVSCMKVSRVCRRLEERGLVVESVRGLGLLGHSRPEMDRSRLSGLALPIADVVLIGARHRERPQLTPLGIEEYAAGVLPTAAVSV